MPWTGGDHAFVRRLNDDEVNVTKDVESLEIIDARNVCLQSVCIDG